MAIETEHPEYLLAWPNGSLWEWDPEGDNGGTHVGDFGRAGFRDAWVAGMADVVNAPGSDVDGVMIDGFRADGWNMGVPGCPADVCNATTEANYGLGVNASMTALRGALPAGAAVIGNYGTATPVAGAGGTCNSTSGSRAQQRPQPHLSARPRRGGATVEPPAA